MEFQSEKFSRTVDTHHRIINRTIRDNSRKLNFLSLLLLLKKTSESFTKWEEIFQKNETMCREILCAILGDIASNEVTR